MYPYYHHLLIFDADLLPYVEIVGLGASCIVVWLLSQVQLIQFVFNIGFQSQEKSRMCHHNVLCHGSHFVRALKESLIAM